MSVVELFRKVVQGKMSVVQAAVRMQHDNQLVHVSELEAAQEKNEIYLSIIKELQELVIQHSVDVHDSHPRMTDLKHRSEIHEQAATALYRGVETLLRNIQQDLEDEE